MKPEPTKIREDGTAILDYVTPASVRFGSGGMVTVGFDHGLVDRDGRPFSPGMFVAPRIQLQGAGDDKVHRNLTNVVMLGAEPFKSFRGSVPADVPIDLYDVTVMLLSAFAGGHPHFPHMFLYSRANAFRITP